MINADENKIPLKELGSSNLSCAKKYFLMMVLVIATLILPIIPPTDAYRGPVLRLLVLKLPIIPPTDVYRGPV